MNSKIIETYEKELKKLEKIRTKFITVKTDLILVQNDDCYINSNSERIKLDCFNARLDKIINSLSVTIKYIEYDTTGGL